MDRLSQAGAMRVLLVSAVEASRDDLERVLKAWSADARLYWVSQSNLAVSRALDVMPHVVFVDSELDRTDPIQLIRAFAARLPGTHVIALVEWDAMAKASQAVLNGARAFLAKPLQEDEAILAIRQVLDQNGAAAHEEPEPAGEPGEVIVFCAPKGGTGRTTLAINTAISLHQETEQPVAMVDADFASPALDVALNLTSDRSIVDVLPRLARLDREVATSILEEHSSGVHVLLAPPPADLTYAITLPQVEQILVWLKSVFPWVVVDLGLPMDETAFAFLDGADRIVLNVLPEMVGLRNTRLMLDQMLARGYPEERIWLAVNRANMPGGISIKDIEARLRVVVRVTIPDDQPLATHSVNRGVPASISHPRSALARAYRTLAQELRASLRPEPAPEGVRGRLLGRLFGSSATQNG